MTLPGKNDCITDVPGIKVGHAQDMEAKTGATVLLFESGAIGGVDARGFATGSRELATLAPTHLVATVHALALAGGSAYGLAAADGVMLFLEEKGIGFDVRGVKVPIVPAAVIFDLVFGDPKVRPDKEMGYQACLNAGCGPVCQGSVGAGIGATIGKLYGMERAMKGGLGTASITLAHGIVVGALAVVNCFGDVYDYKTGKMLAGTREKQGPGLAISADKLKQMPGPILLSPENTTLGVIATNAQLTKAEASMIATMGHDGLARAINPSHSAFDGDIVFALSVGLLECDVNRVGSAGAEVLSIAIKRAVTEADGFGILPGWRDLHAEKY